MPEAPEPNLLSDPIQAPPQQFSTGGPRTGIYHFHDLDWNWTNTLGDPNVCSPPSADPPDGVGFGPPWLLSSMRLFYNEFPAAAVTLTITGVGGSYGPTVLNIPSGPDGLTVAIDPPLHLDNASVLTASEASGLEVEGEIYMTLSGDEIPSTIQGAIDGTNAVFSVGPMLRRAQVWKNGLLMTLNVDCAVGVPSRYVTFLAGHIPQPGDKLLIYGWI